VLVTRRPPEARLFPYTTLFRSNENRDDDQQGNGCCHDIVAMTCLKQAFVQRPAGKADDQRGEDRNYEATKKINSGDKDEDKQPRSEEHTSELQSRENLVCRLLL